MEKVDTKTRILRVAEKIFAEKGFDAARVDEIAREARVNKALIYYYFKSKDDLLEELFKEFMLETLQGMQYSIEELIDFQSEEKILEFFKKQLEYWEGKKNVLRIMMMESLKESSADEPMFRMMDRLIEREEETIKSILEVRGIRTEYDRMEGMISDFFTGLLPLFLFVLYKDEWVEHYGIPEEELKEKFTHVFMITHLSYHRFVIDSLKEPKA